MLFVSYAQQGIQAAHTAGAALIEEKEGFEGIRRDKRSMLSLYPLLRIGH